MKHSRLIIAGINEEKKGYIGIRGALKDCRAVTRTWQARYLNLPVGPSDGVFEKISNLLTQFTRLRRTHTAISLSAPFLTFE